MAERQKKKKGCFTWIFYLIAIHLILGGVVIGQKPSEKKVPKPTATIMAHKETVIEDKTTQRPTAKPTATTTEEPLVIYLRYPELGEYGNYYIFNLFVEKATKDDLNTVIQCFVPPGTYTVTNIGRYPTFVYGYSKETQITSAGWEEPADGWVSNKMLQVGDSCEVTVEEGYYIKLLDNQNFKLVQK